MKDKHADIRYCLGLGKTLFNSAACLFSESVGRPEIELILSERLLRQKASGVWPERAIRALQPKFDLAQTMIGENRDVIDPLLRERTINAQIPFFEHLDRSGLSPFTREFNKSIEFVTHHFSHAMAAVAMSPFSKCVIVVMDGAGTRASDFDAENPEIVSHGPRPEDGGERANEECSVYLHDAGRIRCVLKRWQLFRSGEKHSERDGFSEGVGIFYEQAAEFIFNCKRSAGKVMGLAPLGRADRVVGSRVAYLDRLDWTKAFTGGGKSAWESSTNLSLYLDLAATTQMTFEEELLSLLRGVRERFPDYANVVLTGGCALNCTANGKLAMSGLFDEIYVPPFPGDESIALGAASHLYYNRLGHAWQPLPHDEQHGYFGPRASVPDEKGVESTFEKFEIARPQSIAAHTAKILAEGHVVAWYQGRSESGPRALGNRSILARPDRRGIKDHLNAHIKFREAFRPYGASCPHERAHEYFDVPRGFNTPYMAFAAKTRPEHRERLAEITHVDGTCRYQSVRPGQNARFHELLEDFGRETGLYCLLNTSLNVMGEPIVESLEDARRFLENVPVHGLAIGDFYIRRRG